MIFQMGKMRQMGPLSCLAVVLIVASACSPAAQTGSPPGGSSDGAATTDAPTERTTGPDAVLADTFGGEALDVGSGADSGSADRIADRIDDRADDPDLPPTAARTVGDVYCPARATPYPSPLPPNRQATTVPITPPGGISFLEGPVWLAERGVLLFSEWNAGHRILQLTPPQAVEVFMPATGSNGLALTPDGKSLLMVTEMPAAGVSRVNLADKAVQRLAQNYNGQAFVQPNDLVVRADGIIYFTDYQAGRLYRRALDGALSIISSLPRSNGVAVSPDEKTLYLNADTHTVKYPLAPDGTAGEGTDLASGLSGADGLAIDCAGNVYIAQNSGGAVVVVSAAGARLGEIGGLPRTVTNAAFGGPDRQTLYITTNSALYSLRTEVAGLPY